MAKPDLNIWFNWDRVGFGPTPTEEKGMPALRKAASHPSRWFQEK